MRPSRLAALLLALAGSLALRCGPDPNAPPVSFTSFDLGAFTLTVWERESLLVAGGAIERRYAAALQNRGAAARGVEVVVEAAPPGSVIGPILRFGDVARDDVVADGIGFALRMPSASVFDPASLVPRLLAATPARDARGFEIDPPGEWLRGDLHVHATGASNDTGGDSFPADIAREAQRAGLDFVAMTDHSNSTGSDPATTFEDPALFNRGPEFPYWDEAARLSVPGRFVLVQGNEISPRDPGVAPTGHVSCLPGELLDFDLAGAFVDRPMGAVSGAATLAQARARGCFTVLNHPYAALPWIAFDWTGADYDAMEIWNGGLGVGLSVFELQSRDAWRCDLLQGRSVVPIAASDNHRVYTPAPGFVATPALGWPSTSVLARERTWHGILGGLRAGRVSLHGGDSRLFLDGYDAALQRSEGSGTRVLRVRGRLDGASLPATLRVTRATSCQDTRPAAPPAVAESVLLDVAVSPGEAFDRDVAIGGEAGVYTATLLPNGLFGSGELHRAALSRAVVIRNAAAP